MLINKLEKKFGKYAIDNVALYFIATLIAGYIIGNYMPDVFGLLVFDPYQIFHGQIWRVFTWILAMPIESDNIFLFIIMIIFFYYPVSKQLEYAWGAFKLNFFIFSGLLLTVIGSLSVYLVIGAIYKYTGDASVFLNFFGSQVNDVNTEIVKAFGMQLLGSQIGASVTTEFLLTTLLLGFTLTFPDDHVLLMFLIPIKMKWLGILYGVVMLITLVESPWIVRVVILIALLNFAFFYFQVLSAKNYSPLQQKRHKEFKKKINNAMANATYENGARHKCFVCGQTELDNPNLEFRFCSKCSGGKEYCQEHLFTHVHQ